VPSVLNYFVGGRPSRRQTVDSTAAMLSDPYTFVSEQCDRLGADAFRSRFLLRPTVFLRGPAAVELFYDESRLQRRGAAPEPLRATLFGKGTVQGLDGPEHRSRKQMLLSLCTPQHASRLASLFEEELQTVAEGWKWQHGLLLYNALHLPLMRAACRWAEVPVASHEAKLRTNDVVALYDRAGKSLKEHIRARIARHRAERWLERIIDRVRAHRLRIAPDSVLATIAAASNSDGTLLSRRVAAAELLNLIRPTVATSVFIVDAMHALHQHPVWLENLTACSWSGEPMELFLREVRRYYPFFPAVMARARKDFVWQGVKLVRGQRVVLDLYGTNHDGRAWPDPFEFRPERFREMPSTHQNFVPQGGGDARSGHRCPGEGIVTQLMTVALRFLNRKVGGRWPEQAWSLKYSRLPALPRPGRRLVHRNMS
jgi:fatty-acid peroxygenase